MAMSPSVNCVFCFKTVDGESRFQNLKLENDYRSGKRKEITAKFLKFLQRHSNSLIQHVNQESMASLLIKGFDTSKKTLVDIDSCFNCIQQMSHFLDLYNQLKVLELKVNWAMCSFVNVMSMATKVPSRVKAFNDSFKASSDNSDNEEKVKLKGIRDFRKCLIKKCYHHHGLVPRVLLDKHKTNLTKTYQVKEEIALILSPYELMDDLFDLKVETMPCRELLIARVLIAVLSNSVTEILSKISSVNIKKSATTVHLQSNEHNVTEKVIVIEETEQKSDFDLEAEPCSNDTNYRPPESSPGPPELDRYSPITISAEANTSTSNLITDDCRRVLRARKRFYCNDCLDSFLTHSALVSHQQATHNDPLKTTDDEADDMYDDEGNEDTESADSEIDISSSDTDERCANAADEDNIRNFSVPEEINSCSPIAYENTSTSNVVDKYRTAINVRKECVPTEDTAYAGFKMSKNLSPVQQRLTAALLHPPKFSCKVKYCLETFVFEDLLETHSKLHGTFSCGLCSHVEAYAPKLAEHVLTNHCTTVSSKSKSTYGSFVTCPMATCTSSLLAVEVHHQRNYVFHYLKEHLKLDVSSIGCPICKYINPKGAFSPQTHFETFHGTFSRKPVNDHQCESCPAYFCAESKLNLHKVTFHNQFSKSWKPSCSDCGKKCLTQQHLTEHMERHTKNSQYVCKYVGATKLKIHMPRCSRSLTPSAQDNHQQTTETFATSSALVNHQQTTHTHEDFSEITADKEDEIRAKQYSNSEKTEEEIIQHYANTQFEFFCGKFRIAGTHINGSAAAITSEETGDTVIKTLSQSLSPTQQRLSTALLHNKPKYSCKINNCTEKFVFEDLLQTHLKLHVKLECKLCSYVETYAPEFAEHVLTKHCKRISSSNKLDSFVSCPMSNCLSVATGVKFHQRNYVFHYLTDHLNLNISSLGCPICHYIHPNKAVSNHNHFKTFHNIFHMTPENIRQCEKCPAFFCTSDKLSLHMLTFHNQSLTSCPDCQKDCKGKCLYKNHRRKCIKRQKNFFQHCCSIPNCDARFENLSSLTNHMKTCPNLTPRKKSCKVCGKRVTANHFRLHMLIHSGPESYKHTCLDCGKKCTTSHALKVHMKRHVKDSPFVCKFCGVRYANGAQLRMHNSKLCSRLKAPSTIDNLQQTSQVDIPEPNNGKGDDFRANHGFEMDFTTDLDAISVKEEISRGEDGYLATDGTVEIGLASSQTLLTNKTESDDGILRQLL